MLSRMLRHEPDLYLFGIGLHALGRIGDESSLATLRELSQIRASAEFQKMVAEIMAQTDPAEAFQHHLSCLLEGSANPGMANKAAHQLEEWRRVSCCTKWHGKSVDHKGHEGTRRKT